MDRWFQNEEIALGWQMGEEWWKRGEVWRERQQLID